MRETSDVIRRIVLALSALAAIALVVVAIRMKPGAETPTRPAGPAPHRMPSENPAQDRPQAEQPSTEPDTPPAIPTSPFHNIYSLQTLIDFDTLDGADYDPDTNTLTLGGHYSRTDRLVRVAYLDHLATALEVTHPTFSLDWIRDSAQALKRAKDDPGRLKVVDADGLVTTPFGAWLYGVGGLKTDVGSPYKSLEDRIQQAGGFQALFGGRGTLAVPSDIVPTTFKAVPMSKPIAKGMPTDSLLAQIALEADLAEKAASAMPELKQKIPGYMTYAEWERLKGEVKDPQKTWIEPAGFEITESSDHRMMRFDKTPIAFRMRKFPNGRLQIAGEPPPPDAADPVLTGYAALLTDRYDALAAELPALHEIRECIKVIAVARWAKKRGWKVTLPAEGRIKLPVLDRVPGIVSMQIDLKVARTRSGETLDMYSLIWESGGVNLDPDDTSVVRIGNLKAFPVIPPMAEPNDQLRRITAHLDKIGPNHDQEVPMPNIPGWVAEAKGGQAAQQYVSMQMNAAASCVNSAALLAQLDRIKAKANVLESFDKVLNAQKLDRISRLEDLDNLASQARAKRSELLIKLIQIAGSLGTKIDVLYRQLNPPSGLQIPRLAPLNSISLPYAGLPAKELLDMAKKVDKTRDYLEKLNALLNRKEDSTAFWTAVVKQTTTFAVSVELWWNELHGQVAAPGLPWPAEIAARRSVIVAIGFAVGDMVKRTTEAILLARQTDTISTSLGTAAIDLHHVQDSRKTAEDDYLTEKRTYETMHKKCN